MHRATTTLLLLLLCSGLEVCSAGSISEKTSNPFNALNGTSPSLIWSYNNPSRTPESAFIQYGDSVDGQGLIKEARVIGVLYRTGGYAPQLDTKLNHTWSGNTITITLLSVAIQDTMYYAVQLRGADRRVIPGLTSTGLKLFVQDPVNMTVAPKDHRTTEGEDVTMECQASGHPAPDITWQRINDPTDLSQTQTIQTTKVSSVLTKSTLTIKSPQRTDTGIYQCNASNGVKDPVTAQATFQMQYKSNIRPSCRHVGENFILHCEVIQSALSLVEYEFNTDGVSGTLRSADPTKILLAEDQAWWRCRARNLEKWGGWSAMTKIDSCVKDNPTFRKQVMPEECTCSVWRTLFGVLCAILIIFILLALFLIYNKKILAFLKGEKYTDSQPLTRNTPPRSYVNNSFNDLNSMEMRRREGEGSHDDDKKLVGLNGIKLSDKGRHCNIPDTVEESEYEINNDPDAV